MFHLLTKGKDMKFTKVICFAISVLFLQSLEALADWDVDNSKKSVTASITGNITHGERQRFYFSKSNCDVVQHIFSAYTTKTADFEKLEGKVLAIEFNGDKIGTRLIAAKKAMLGHLLMFGLGTYDRDFIVKLIKKNELITITCRRQWPQGIRLFRYPVEQLVSCRCFGGYRSCTFKMCSIISGVVYFWHQNRILRTS